METILKLPDGTAPTAISELLAVLRKEYFTARHDAKAWGDWIHLDGYQTVISLECNHGVTSSATIEHAEGEEEGEPTASILKAFAKLGWNAIDDEGEYAL